MELFWNGVSFHLINKGETKTKIVIDLHISIKWTLLCSVMLNKNLLGFLLKGAIVKTSLIYNLAFNNIFNFM